ncbi:hypothetical protein [Rhodobacter ferrooxidans]|uniref:Sialate O-acetylesterase domain-containing protein n=1 Tax=Rhodobacter ferrooxidans TaxID=371731 RepID=C8RX14_9RHOB|nr:hypothetical protein [Rhodobacter sp. SW2]EEW26539.1 conserved hypothetical protein [Rhodobacter sp. SW2]
MPLPPKPIAETGVLIRAENGDVVTWDATGLTLRLSDTVLADLRARLALQPAEAPDVTAALGDIDAWNLRSDGGWLRFTGVLEPGRGPREYQRAQAGGDIIAAAPGPLYALLAIGGARRAGFNDGPPGFSHNVLAPGDDVGSVGLEGTAQAQPTASLQRLPHCSREALTADTLLGWRQDALRGMPLFFVRAETDGAASITALASGVAYGNFLTALDNLVAAATSSGKRPKVLAVGLDYGLEDIHSPPDVLAEGLRSLMRQIERDMAARDLQRPIFLANFDSGTRWLTAPAATLAHWQLAWSHGNHAFAFAAPGYMFDQDRFGRPSEAARLQMAEMDAHAIVALSARESWACPLFLLAESEGREVRVTARAMADLVLDAADPFGAGVACGFSIAGSTAPVQITAVRLAKDDPQSLILTCDHAPEGDATLHYAYGGPEGRANSGSVRDAWAAPSRSGGQLHRWAYPAILPLRRGET